MFFNSNWTLERYDNDISGHLKIGKSLFGRLSSARNRYWQAIIWQWTIWQAFKLQSTIWQKIFGQTIKRQRAFLPSWHLVKICLARYFWRWIGQSWTNWQLDKGAWSSKFVFIYFYWLFYSPLNFMTLSILLGSRFTAWFFDGTFAKCRWTNKSGHFDAA